MASALSDGVAEPSDEGATRRTRRGGAFFRSTHGTRRAVRVALSAGAKRLWKSRARKTSHSWGSLAPSCFRRQRPDRTPGPLGGNMLIRLALASLVVALVAAVIGFSRAAADFGDINRSVAYVLVLVFCVTLLLEAVTGRKPAS